MADVRTFDRVSATQPASGSVRRLVWLVMAVLACAGRPAAAQIVEATGTRALGMGGAFVAVADDDSATWWNPGALADAPLLNMSLAWATTEASGAAAARRHRVGSFAIAAPMFGLSYYRLRLTEIRDSSPTAGGGDGREEEQGEVPVRSLAASQLGVTILRTLIPGVHAGTTLKYVRGTHRASVEPQGGGSDLLDRGDGLEGGDAGRAFDLDVGILAVGGPIKVGAVVRNLRTPEFEDPSGAVMKLPRQVRLGIAFDGARVGRLPLTASLDADLRRYETATGDRRVVAAGAEHWFFGRRIGVRAGGRFNTVGAEDRAATWGLSVALSSAAFLDGYQVRGGSAEDQGWGIAARVLVGGYR